MGGRDIDPRRVRIGIQLEGGYVLLSFRVVFFTVTLRIRPRTAATIGALLLTAERESTADFELDPFGTLEVRHAQTAPPPVR